MQIMEIVEKEELTNFKGEPIKKEEFCKFQLRARDAVTFLNLFFFPFFSGAFSFSVPLSSSAVALLLFDLLELPLLVPVQKHTNYLCGDKNFSRLLSAKTSQIGAIRLFLQ